MKTRILRNAFWSGLLCTGLLLLGSPAAQAQDKADKKMATLKVSESLRQEALTRTELNAGGSSSETETISKGKVKMEIVIVRHEVASNE